jgi:hypothetical protein
MRRVGFMLLVAFSLLLTACAAAPSPEDFAKNVRKNVSLPAGVWYREGTEPWEEGCLPKEW